MPQRRRAPLTHSHLLETLEERTLMSTSYAVMVMDAPIDTPSVQIDKNSITPPVDPDATLASTISIQVRKVASGIYLTAAASSQAISPLAPTGTVDFYDNLQFLGTVQLGKAFRNTLVLSPGKHTFFATYNGDSNFLPTQASITKNLTAPTNTPPKSPTQAKVYATNGAGERVRPTRTLSRVNFFDAQGLSVAALPPGSGNNSGPMAPDPQFSSVSFSVPAPTKLQPPPIAKPTSTGNHLIVSHFNLFNPHATTHHNPLDDTLANTLTDSLLT